MRALPLLLIATALAACGSTPYFDREILADDPARPAAVAPGGADGTLRATVLRVGQGDSILIEAPNGEAILVDAGPPGAGVESVLPYLEHRGIFSLQHAIITHAHLDHFGGLSEVLAGADGIAGNEDDIELEGYLYDDGQLPSEDVRSLYPWSEEALSPRRATLDAGQRIELGDCDIEAVASGARLADGTVVDAGDPPDENANSVALLLSCGGFSMFLAGDITGGGGNPPYDTPDLETPLAPLLGDIDVLKVAHHGSLTSTNEEFIRATSPEIAIISVGDGNDHFHPHGSVVDRLLDAEIAVYQTERGWLDREGPVVADGNITIEVEGDGEYRVILE